VASLVAYVKEDPYFAALLGLIAISAVHSFATGHPVIGGLAILVFWGLLTFQYWVYIVVVALCGLSVVLGMLSLLLSGEGWYLAEIVSLVFQIAVLVILLNKSDRYI
jgi:hypothetical protein